MEDLMRDLALQAAGVLAMVTALIHTVLGETRVFATARIEPPGARRIIRAVWLGFTVAWIAGGALLLLASLAPAESVRMAIIAAVVPIYLGGVIGNAWATRGRHFGWMLLALVVALALAGL
jgi:hypothetical protein